MCNLSLGVLEKGFEKGFGEGKEEGFGEGLDKGIIGCVKLLRKNGMSDPEIVSEIMEEYQLTQEKAEEYVFAAAKA